MAEGVRICVAVVEDYPSYAYGLVLGFISAGFTVLATVTSPDQLDGVQPDVVVSDLHLGQVPIRETVSALVRRGLRVLAISGPATGEEILDAIDAGAQGFADKLWKTSTICAAAAEVAAAGGGRIGPRLAGHSGSPTPRYARFAAVTWGRLS